MMKKVFLLFVFCMVVMLSCNTTSKAHAGAAALEYKIAYEIPERYVLVEVESQELDDFLADVRNSTDLTNKDELSKRSKSQDGYEKLSADCQLILKTVKTEKGVKVAQLAIYGKGSSHTPENLLGVMEYFKDDPGGLMCCLHKKVSEVITSLLGYNGISPEELWHIYDDNEVVGDEDFTGRPIVFQNVQINGVAKDIMGNPYVDVTLEDLLGIPIGVIRISLDPKDPALRKLKKGQKINVRFFPKGFTVRTLHGNGRIIELPGK